MIVMGTIVRNLDDNKKIEYKVQIVEKQEEGD
jgi:hypothetical protein